MDFSQALEKLKQDRLIARNNWKDKNIFLKYKPEIKNVFNLTTLKSDNINFEEHILMMEGLKPAVFWIPTQKDVLAKDWIIII